MLLVFRLPWRSASFLCRRRIDDVGAPLQSGSFGPMDWEVWVRPISTGQQASAPVAQRGDRQARPRPQGMHVCWNVSISARIC